MIALHVSGAVWGDWSPDPLALTLVPLGAFLYALGLYRSRGSRRKRHPWWRPLCFYAGLMVILLALVSPIDHLAGELFSLHMVQHFLLVMVAPPLILLSAPMIPVLRGIPVELRRTVVIPVLKFAPLRVVLRTLVTPLISWPLYVIVLLGWHAPPLYQAALRNEVLHVLEHVLFAGTATLWWWNVIDPIPLRARLSYLARVPYVFITMVPTFILGAFLTYSPRPWYPFYENLTTPYGLSLTEDQGIGGVVMWIPGSLALLTTLLIVLLYVVRTEERAQREREALEDRARQARAHRATTNP